MEELLEKLRDLAPGVPDIRLKAIIDVVAGTLERVGSHPDEVGHDDIKSDVRHHRIRRASTRQIRCSSTSNSAVSSLDPDLILDLGSGSGSDPDLSKLNNRDLGLDEPPGFLEFWGLYPKRVGKADARRAWRKHKPPITKVRAALAWQRRSLQWLKGYTPNPATWINRGQWDDEPSTDMRSRGYSEREIDSANGIQLALEDWNARIEADEHPGGAANGARGGLQRRDDEAEDDGLPDGRRGP